MQIGSIARASFYFTFKDVTPEDDMKTFLETTYTKENHLKEIMDDQMITYICELPDEGEVGFAQLHLHEPKECVSDPDPIELQRIYVFPNFISFGIGKILMERCIKEAKDLGYKTMWLGVWEGNERAKKFYAKFGFEKVGEHIFQVGQDAQRDFIYQATL